MADKIGKFLTTRIIHHGPGALGKLDGEIGRSGATRVGIVTDRGVVEAGIVERVLAEVKAATFTFDEVQPDPSYELVGRCVAFLKDTRCDLVIGVGGGSSMDTAKMAAVMMRNTGDVPDFFGRDRIPKPGLPVIAIPTTAGTGSEVSPAAVFVDPRDRSKKGVRSDFLLPEAAILDPVLTLTLPQPLTASTGIDALTHAIEAYSASQAALMSDLAAERSIQLIGGNLLSAYARGDDLSAREGMLMGSFLAGIALAVAGVGAVHALAHVLGGTHRIGHGVANALFLPYVMEFNRIGCREKYAKVAALLGERVEGLSLDDASLKAIESVRRLNRDLRIPQLLRDLQIPQDSLDLIAERCMETQGRILANNPRVLSLEEARQILRRAY